MQYIFFKVINRLFSLLKFINAYYFNMHFHSHIMGMNSHLLTTALRIYYDYTNALQFCHVCQLPKCFVYHKFGR